MKTRVCLKYILLTIFDGPVHIQEIYLQMGEGYPRVVIWKTLCYEVGAKLQYKEPFFHQHEECKRSACS